LCGGLGTRIANITKIQNKHLLPVYDRLMVEYPLETLVTAGIEEILLITGPEHCGSFLNFLGDGSNWGVDITIKAQMKPLGIAHAIGLGEKFIGKENFAVILGDNYFEDDFSPYLDAFDGGACIFLKEVADPERFGVAELDEAGRVLSIEEKPKKPKSNYAVTGFYLYDSKVFDFIKRLKPSARGELEITDVNNQYIKIKKLKAHILQGFWSDMGTYDTILRTANFIKDKMTKLIHEYYQQA